MTTTSLKNMNLGQLQERARELSISDEGTRAQLRDRISEKVSEAAPAAEDPFAALRNWAPPQGDLNPPVAKPDTSPVEMEIIAPDEPSEPEEEPVSPPESHADEPQESSGPSLRERAEELGVYVSLQWTDEQVSALIEAYETAARDAANAPTYAPTSNDEAHFGYDHELASPRG